MQDCAPSSNRSGQIDAVFCIARLQHIRQDHNLFLGHVVMSPTQDDPGAISSVTCKIFPHPSDILVPDITI